MHEISNILSTTLTYLHNLLPSHSNLQHTFHDLIKTISPKWYPTKPLIPQEMKQFFHLNLITLLVNIFTFLDTTLILPWPSTPHTFLLTISQAVHMILTSIQTYYHFAYTVSPSTHDFACLLIARDCFLSFLAYWKKRQTPTIHFLTNHAIEDAIKDNTAYLTLQEAVEYLNHTNKVEYRGVFLNPHPSNHILESS